MSAISLQEDDFVYPTSSPKETGPLRLLTFTSKNNTVLSFSLVDAKKGDEFFAISYAWDRPVCKLNFNVYGDISCVTHCTAPWTNNKALCNNYLSNFRSEPDGYTDIFINRMKFYVQDTVYHLLRAIKKRVRKGAYFWLDAICINQNDRFGRKRQTSNMHEIYKAAKHVYVWLGTAYDSSDSAMDFLDRLPVLEWSTKKTSHEILQEYVYECVTRKTTHEFIQELVNGYVINCQSRSEDLSSELYCLFDRPYWKRTWVIQEFLLAEDLTLLCGDREVSSTKALYLVERLDNDTEFRKRHPLWNVTPGVRMFQARKAFRSFPGKPALEDMIHHFLFSRSTYPEDKLIGLLNVSLSNADTNFNGTPGSTEKRVEVINEVVRDIQGREMDTQTAQCWKHLLACLLGIRKEFSKPTELHLFPERDSDAPSSSPRRGYAASSASRDMRAGPPKVPQRQYAATSIAVPVVGSVRPSQPGLGSLARTWTRSPRPLPQPPPRNGTTTSPHRPDIPPDDNHHL